MSEYKLNVTGMTCEHCVKAVRQALEDVDGVQEVKVTLEPGTAIVKGDVEEQKLVEAVKEEGYNAQPAA